jgi:hypothetical protein
MKKSSPTNKIVNLGAHREQIFFLFQNMRLHDSWSREIKIQANPKDIADLLDPRPIVEKTKTCLCQTIK